MKTNNMQSELIEINYVKLFLLLAFLNLSSQGLFANYVEMKPLRDTISSSSPRPVLSKDPVSVPLIAWGGDIQTILANGNSSLTQPGSVFANNGLNIRLFREDVFPNQVKQVLDGKTPFLRGTMGMINSAVEQLDLTVIYQLTWSAGGDALVVRENIKNPHDLKGKTIAIQAYGPHVDYLVAVLKTVGLSIDDVKIKWVPDLLELDQNSFSPATALVEDPSVDAAMVIIPDALALTSGGNVGNGAEGSVRGARILFSTKTASRVIADVYAVRTDFLESNRDFVKRFVKSLLQAEEQLKTLVKNQDNKRVEYENLMRASAKLLLDDSNALDDIAGMYLDAEFSGFSGNVKFFADPQYPRNFNNLTREIQNTFITMGLLEKQNSLLEAGWNYQSMSSGLKNTEGNMTSRFDQDKVSAVISQRQQSDNMEDGELFSFEIYFKPNQNSFPADLYQKEFDKVIDLASVYAGALLTVEGHSDPMGYLRKKKAGADLLILNRIKQSARNLSYNRANAVRESLISYAESKNLVMDPSQFGVVGHGIMKPNTSGASYDASGDLSLRSAPQSKEEWNRTRRVVFRLIQIEAEADVFMPL